MRYKPVDGYPYYYELVKDEDLERLFSSQTTFTFLESITEEKAGHRYAPNKWSIKQIVGHIADHERIKMSRAFQLSRNEPVALWGYDQESLVRNAHFDELTIAQLALDIAYVRKASQSFISMLSEAQLSTVGKAREHEVTLAGFLKSIIGHERHHINIIKEKYLKKQWPQ